MTVTDDEFQTLHDRVDAIANTTSAELTRLENRINRHAFDLRDLSHGISALELKHHCLIRRLYDILGRLL